MYPGCTGCLGFYQQNTRQVAADLRAAETMGGSAGIYVISAPVPTPVIICATGAFDFTVQDCEGNLSNPQKLPTDWLIFTESSRTSLLLSPTFDLHLLMN